MARGDSGRIVVEVDPYLKAELYVELARRGLTLKAWFIGEAEHLVETSRQPVLFVAESPPTPYTSSKPEKDLP